MNRKSMPHNRIIILASSILLLCFDLIASPNYLCMQPITCKAANNAITSLTRTGNGASNYGNMDILSYSYASNKLQNIYDWGTSYVYDGIFEFVSNTISSSGNRYTYNSAGDLIQDANKGLSLIEYDLFGHPRRIQHHNGNVTEYVYAATGEKLRTKHTTAVEGLSVPLGQTLELTDNETMDVDSVDYWGNLRITKEDIVTHHGVVGMTYQFGGGYFAVTPQPYRPPHSTAVGVQYVPSFFYYVNDYQGNVRLVVDGNGTMAQRNDYYAYGGPWSDNAFNQGFQPFKYNGKELDRMHGLDWYDYGARMYDPAMGLFTQIDPLAEQYPHLNPYLYCAGNPVKYVDPDGKSIWTKLIKSTVKVGKQVAKSGTKALGETATYATAVADIVDDVNVLTDSEAPTSDRIWAGVSLASEFLPVSINDAKDVGKIVKHADLDNMSDIGRKAKTIARPKSINQLQKDVERGST